MKKMLFTMVCMTTMLLHGATVEEAKRTLHEFHDLHGRRLELTDTEKERYRQVSEEMRGLGFDAFPVYYEMLEQGFDDPGRVSYVMNAFNRDDGKNLASEGKKEALDWARKVLEAYSGKKLISDFIVLDYLARKGDAGDIELFKAVDARRSAMEILTARVAGTNVFRVFDDHFDLRLEVVPSVTNTGPQGVYVNEIIMQAWENAGGAGDDWEKKGADLSKIPPELLTMVVSFDADGKPVCNVDLAKLGLSMPVIKPKPTSMDSRGLKRTVTFPPPDETPPKVAAALDKMTKAQIVNKMRYNATAKDIWWHDDSALLGHGFAYFQYEGPAENGNLLHISCAPKQYDHKYYIGKTGDDAFSHWDYTDGGANRRSELAWWDICPYKVEGEFLVLKQTYTLTPDRAYRLFQIIEDTSRHEHFGLDINQAANAWGCLSNVGLAMETNKLDVANITRCIFSENMPTTVNKSVWDVIFGAEGAQGMLPHEKLFFMQSIIDAVVGETAGEPWGGGKAITQQGNGTLQGKLFTILNGKTIVQRNPAHHSGYPTSPVTITTINQIILQEHQTDLLRYYDPGKFPGVFGERPKNVFNMDN